jgi:hypothetical protein
MNKTHATLEETLKRYETHQREMAKHVASVVDAALDDGITAEEINKRVYAIMNTEKQRLIPEHD